MASKRKKKKSKSLKKTKVVRETTRASTQTESFTEEESQFTAYHKSLKAEAQEHHRRRQIRRQIRVEFQPLLEKDRECEISEIAEFICRFDEEIDLMRDVLQPFKSDSFPAIMVWRYLLGETDEKLDRLLTESKLLEEQKVWLETNLPDPILVPVEITKHGPGFDAFTTERIQETVGQLIGETAPNFRIGGSFPFHRLGDHLIHLELSKWLVLSRTVRLELCQDELPPDCLEDLANASPLPLSETADVLRTLQQYLAEASPSDILTYYPRMSTVLITAYNAGYWKAPWVQDVLWEWRTRRKEYLLTPKLHEIPDPIIVPVEITERGPRFDAFTTERIQETVGQLIGETAPNFRIGGSFPFHRLGDHLIHLELSKWLVLSRTVRLELCQDELPPDCLEGLANASPLPLSETADVLRTLQQYLAEASPSDILTYYPHMSTVLITAYNTGYWKAPWVQDVLRKWRAKREEYALNRKLREVGELIEQINRKGPWMIPDEYDTEALSERKVLEIAQGIVAEDVELSQHPIEVSFDGNVNRTVLPVEVLFHQLPAGTLKLLRSTTFMPVDVRQEILQAEVAHLTEMINCTSEQELLEIANRENRDALKIVDEWNRRDYPARARYLAGICRVLLERGKIEEVQFKRTLTCYYAARGGEFFMGGPLRARRYYLLFFRMLYQEGMLEHLKAIAPLDYWVLAAFFATYLDRPIRAMKAPDDIRSLEKTQPLAPMLWRATQLLHESPRKFFDALFDLYLVEPDFVRDLLANLRQVRRRGSFSLRRRRTFTLDYLNVDSTELPMDIMAYSVESAPTSVTTDLLLDFILSVLDIRDIAQPVLNDFERMMASVRQFMSAKDVVQKSALYTDVDRGFLQARGVAMRIAGKLRGGREETRKKAGRLMRLIVQIKAHVDRMHREFFRNAKLEVEINTFTLPRNELSPVEIRITNADLGPASNVALQIERDPSFRAREYNIPLDPIYGKDKRIEALYISPLAEKAVELRGIVRYSDQEEPDKVAPFQHTINVSDPLDFKPFYSPYITGVPVRDSEMFFGRREELDEVIRLLRGHFQDRITVIHGRRKVGKTSVLFQLKQGAPNLLGVPTLREMQERYIPALVDFERFTAEKATWEVYYHICQSIRQELDLVGIPTTSIPMQDFRDLSADALFESFIVQVEQSLTSNERKLLLMFDEFDTLIRNKGEERGLFGFIRELIIRHGQHISFIFVGADELVGMMKTRTNRLYSMAGTPIEIADLAPEEAQLLVTKPMKKVNPEFEWAEDAIRLIVHVTARNPYYIQTLCDRVVNNLIAGKRLRATTIDIEQGVREVVDHIGDLADIVDNLENVEEKIILACIADLAQHERLERVWVAGSEIGRRIKDVSRKFPRKAIPGVLRSLQARYILDQREEEMEMRYCIRVPLLQIYIQNALKLKDVLREGEYA